MVSDFQCVLLNSNLLNKLNIYNTSEMKLNKGCDIKSYFGLNVENTAYNIVLDDFWLEVLSGLNNSHRSFQYFQVIKFYLNLQIFNLNDNLINSLFK